MDPDWFVYVSVVYFWCQFAFTPENLLLGDLDELHSLYDFGGHGLLLDSLLDFGFLQLEGQLGLGSRGLDFGIVRCLFHLEIPLVALDLRLVAQLRGQPFFLGKGDLNLSVPVCFSLANSGIPHDLGGPRHSKRHHVLFFVFDVF